ncbi:unnamed protein product [Arctia plantaginis]|uniref:BPTI/Kunitz inhibitor domain-containing protein n=1 Tax=Arctia plantaginis TaxID=874455 RepID=A0A8S0YR56_ARCPL|nr:unnamed protein product [Arctia plantaginis]CAB3251288.1 unnamed protein product [Arctia plantaginis]
MQVNISPGLPSPIVSSVSIPEISVLLLIEDSRIEFGLGEIYHGNQLVLSKTCTLKPDKGPCRGGIEMYYFDVSTSNCSTFAWGGCQGNGNRFNTLGECLDKCLSKKGSKKPRPKFCALTYDYGYCFGALERWYYDNIWKMCKKTIYSGCGGNDNNFLYRDQCESVCLFGKGFIKSKRTTKEHLKKVLIINPETKGKYQAIFGDERKSAGNSAPASKTGAESVTPGQPAADGPHNGVSDTDGKSSANDKPSSNGKPSTTDSNPSVTSSIT